MHDLLFRTICRVGIFMICAQAVIHFRPRESYEKYLKLLVSVMVLIQLFLPIGGILLGGGVEEVLAGLEEFREALEQEMETAAREAEAADALLEEMTLEEVRQRMEERAAEEEGTAAEKKTDAEKEFVEEESAAEAGGEASEISIVVDPIKIE